MYEKMKIILTLVYLSRNIKKQLAENGHDAFKSLTSPTIMSE